MHRNIPEHAPVFLRSAALSAAIAAVLSLASGLADASTVVRQVSGTVEIGRGEPPVWSPLAVGNTIAPDERVRTGGDGRVELSVDAGTLRVHENSLLKLPPPVGHADRVELETGHSLFDVLRREGRRFEVHTPSVVVSVKGTRFGVEASEQAGLVSVYRGAVGVRSSESSEVVETLVREGFLAVGGGKQPLELDLAPEGDPWAEWQDFLSGPRANSHSEAPESDLDRAKTSLRRATDVDVLKRAAERRPEIAERLRRHTSETKPAPTPRSEPPDADSERAPVPASPAIDDSVDGRDTLEIDPSGGKERPLELLDSKDRTGDPNGRTDPSLEPKDTQSEILDLQRNQSSLRMVDTVVDVSALTGGVPLQNGATMFSTDHLVDYDPREVLMLMNAMQQLSDASASLARPWTDGDMASYLEGQLTQQGMDLREAQMMVQGLFR